VPLSMGARPFSGTVTCTRLAPESTFTAGQSVRPDQRGGCSECAQVHRHTLRNQPGNERGVARPGRQDDDAASVQVCMGQPVHYA